MTASHSLFRCCRPHAKITSANRLRRRLQSNFEWLCSRPTLQYLEDRTVPATITVTNNLDTVALDGSVSIREALESINAGSNVNADVSAVGAYGTTDTVLFHAGLASPISLVSGQLNVSSRVNIVGPGANLLTIQNTKAASDVSRVFNITDGPTTISGLKLTGGNATTNGGGIASSATVTLNNVEVSGNVTGVNGGGIAISGGAMSLSNCLISNNVGSGASRGGGIFVGGLQTLSVDNSTISDNSSGYIGGGICCYFGGTLNLTSSTVSGNKSNTQFGYYGGGGIYLRRATATICNSTISGNSTNSAGKDVPGGGILTQSGPATLLIENSTIAFNDAGTSTGGGISRTAGTDITLVNTIISNNSAATNPDVNGIISLADHSILGNDTGATITLNNGSIIADPLLDVLANNGGPTASHSLKAGSPAINAGTVAAPITQFDQRGAGFPRRQGGGTDIGAIEASDSAPSAVATSTKVAVAGGMVQLVTVVYSDTTGSKLINASTLGTGDITVTGPNGFTATPTIVGGPYSDAPSITVTYQFNAADNSFSGKWDESDDGVYEINIVAGQVLDKDAPTPLSVPAFIAGTLTVAAPITYVVDEISDVDNGIVSAGKQSIREAIGQANADGVPSVIVFDAGIFGGTKTITMTEGQFQILEGVTIIGPTGGLILDGAAKSRIFELDMTTLQDAVAMSNLTITNGKVVGDTSDALGPWDGGAIRVVDAALTLTNVTVSNSSSNKLGGGIALDFALVGDLLVSPSLDLIDCTITGNVGAAQLFVDGYNSPGGGIMIRGNSAVNILRSNISGNLSSSDGGGIYFFGGNGLGGSLTMNDSIVSGNKADLYDVNGAGGGGIYLFNTVAVILNSTISNNTSGSSSGGIAARGGSSLTIKNSTVVYNHALSAGGGIGGTYSDADSAQITLESTILANNSTDSFGPETNLAVRANWSLIGNTSEAKILGNHNQLDVSAGLAPFNYYGGPTQTYALLPGSAAINNGSNIDSLAFDQRGSGFNRQVGPAVDIGAVEGAIVIPSGALTAPTLIVTGGLTPNTVEVTYTDDVGIDAAKIDIGDIQVLNPASVPLTITGVTFTATPTGGKAVYTFAVPGGTWSPADNGTYTVRVLAGQVFDSDVPTPHEALGGSVGTFKVDIAGIYLVDEVSDIDDGLTGVGQLSLREAIKAANADLTPSVINFDAKVFNGTKTIVMGGQDYFVTEAVTINGPQGGLVFDANFKSRIFNFESTTRGDLMSISNMTLTNGVSPFYGGAIVDQFSSLTLTNVIISNCTAPSHGGGIFYVPRFGKLTLIDCQILNNTALNTGRGGGIRMFENGPSSLILERTTISGNKSGHNGGGVYMPFGSRLVMDDSTVSGNTANNKGVTYGYLGGGGVAFAGTTATIRNSTISGNTVLGADATGGGLFVYDSFGTVNLLNSTIAFNNSAGKGGGIGFGGYYAGSTTVTANSTIISGNKAALGGNDVNGKIAADFSLVSDTAGATINGANNLLNVDPLLGPLAFNGGPTQTHALVAGSPAIGTGNNSASLAFDQRGNPREFNHGVDIGAFELQGPAKVSSIVINDGNAQRSTVTKLQVTFSQHIGLAAGAAFSLTRVSDAAVVNLAASIDESGSGTLVTLTFTGGAVEGNSLADGRYALHVLAAGFNAEGFDGNGDGISGDDYFFDQPVSPAPGDLNKIFRLFGDADGNGTVSAADFNAFRLAYGTTGPSIFDFNGDNQVSATDFNEFRTRYGVTLVP